MDPLQCLSVKLRVPKLLQESRDCKCLFLDFGYRHGVPCVGQEFVLEERVFRNNSF